MKPNPTDPKTISDRIIKTFIDQLSARGDFEKIAQKLEKAILDKYPSEQLIRAALFDEERAP